MLPIQFEYVLPNNSKDTIEPERVYLTIIGQFKHHYTGQTMYRVREESSRGKATESIITEYRMNSRLSMRVKE